MIKIGVIGVGHLGKIHLKLLDELDTKFEIVGFYDTDKELAKKLNRSLRIQSFKKIDELIENCHAIVISSPTLSHFEYAEKAIKSHKHVFIEKPITNTLEEADKLMKLALEAGIKVQIGHVERFNPAYLAAQPYIDSPLFIEAHRLSEFNPRGTDVPVVLDLMIHDIDIILSIIKSNISKVSASGVAVISDSHDIANCRLEFDNGTVCNITSSRMSLKKMRKLRIFQKNAYISIDLLDKKTEIIKLKNLSPSQEVDPFAMILDVGKNNKRKQIYFENPEIKETNAIKEELISFYDSITNNTEPKVSISDGVRALELAHQILDKMNSRKLSLKLK
ncbi:MAG: Gfo/Idh/MocA family protein [Flavobacteriales bacterium]